MKYIKTFESLGSKEDKIKYFMKSFDLILKLTNSTFKNVDHEIVEFSIYINIGFARGWISDYHKMDKTVRFSEINKLMKYKPLLRDYSIKIRYEIFEKNGNNFKKEVIKINDLLKRNYKQLDYYIKDDRLGFMFKYNMRDFDNIIKNGFKSINK